MEIWVWKFGSTSKLTIMMGDPFQLLTIFAINFRVYETKFFKLLKTQISARQHSKLFVSPGGNFALQEQQDGKGVVLKLNFNKVSWCLLNR